jgi:hypothetical protein
MEQPPQLLGPRNDQGGVIANGYCTLAVFSKSIGIPEGDRTDDEKAELSIEAASRLIDGHCGKGRKFWQDATVIDRKYWPSCTGVLYVDDISTTTGLIVKADQGDDGTFETTLTINTDFIVEPVNAAAEFPIRPYTRIRLLGNTLTSWPLLSSGRPSVQVTAKYGWPAIPDAIERACVIQARQIFKSHDGASYQMSVDGIPMRSPVIDPTARVLLEPFIRYDEVDDGS